MIYILGIKCFSFQIISTILFSPLTFLHSIKQDAIVEHAPKAIPIINISLTAELYASGTNGRTSSGRILRMPVAPASIIIAGTIPGILSDILLTRTFDRMDCETARNIAPLKTLSATNGWDQTRKFG